MYDVIIIGLGPAGVSACIYAKRSNLNVLGMESNMIGGELNYVDKIDNYPGLVGTSGSDFAFSLKKELDTLEIPYVFESVTSIKKEDTSFKVTTNKQEYTCKKVIVATGRTPLSLGLPNEENLLGKGISRCAVCDGAFFKDKEVAVVGGGDSAIQEAIYLSKIVNKVYVIHRRNEFRALPVLVNKLKDIHNIECLMEEEVVSINGTNYLESITLKSGKTLPVSGLFIYVGYKPSLTCLKELSITDESGYVLVDNNYESKLKGLYAIGDAIKKEYYQVVIAASEGAMVSLNVAKDLQREQ